MKKIYNALLVVMVVFALIIMVDRVCTYYYNRVPVGQTGDCLDLLYNNGEFHRIIVLENYDGFSSIWTEELEIRAMSFREMRDADATPGECFR